MVIPAHCVERVWQFSASRAPNGLGQEESYQKHEVAGKRVHWITCFHATLHIGLTSESIDRFGLEYPKVIVSYIANSKVANFMAAKSCVHIYACA